jgi:hypothetical protein
LEADPAVRRRAPRVARRAKEHSALSPLIEGEQQLLAGFDARQANADTKTAAAVAAAVAVPTLTLTLAKSLAEHEWWLNVTTSSWCSWSVPLSWPELGAATRAGRMTS